MSSPATGSRWVNVAESTGAAFLGLAETVGGMGVLFGRILSRLFAFPPRLGVDFAPRFAADLSNCSCTLAFTIRRIKA